MELAAWIDKYNSKVKEGYDYDLKGFKLFYREDKGFCEVKIVDDEIIAIRQLCGDARFFKEKIDEVAEQLGIKKGATWCSRPEIKAYIRLFGFRITKEENTPTGIKYYGIDKQGRRGTATPTHEYDGVMIYFIKWETYKEAT